MDNMYMSWLMQLGLGEEKSLLVFRVCAVLGIYLIAIIVDKVCRKLIVPLIHKFTAKTESDWDNYLFSDDVMKNICR